MSSTDLPAINALLNGTAATLLVTGYVLVRSGRREAHRRAMTAAFACSVLFLVSYLSYHFQAGSVRFRGTGSLRTLYLSILLTHTVLAAAVPFLAVATIALARRGRLDAHRRLARVTLPVWLYVSVTGVVIYLMLYRMGYGPTPAASRTTRVTVSTPSANQSTRIRSLTPWIPAAS